MTSARWKKARAPTSRYGTARSSRATASAWPSRLTERTTIPTSPGATPERTSRSTSPATAWACARSFAQRQKRTVPSRPPASTSLASRSSHRGDHGARGGVDGGGAAEGPRHAHDAQAGDLLGERAQPERPGAAQAPDRRVVVARRRQPPVGRAGELEDEAQPGELEVLRVVDEHVAHPRAQARADVRLAGQEPVGQQHEVARVQRAGGGQQPVVGPVERGELALALGALVAGRQRGGPPLVLARGDHRVLEAVDPGDHARQQRRRVAAQVVAAQRQLVDVLEQQGEPVGGPDRHDEGVQPGLERLVAQQARAEAVHRVDGQLREPAVSASSTSPRSASAAGAVAVSARTSSGATPPPVASHAWRAASTAVFPVPAAPSRRTGSAGPWTTARCSGERSPGGTGTLVG